MTEIEWSKCRNPEEMLAWLRERDPSRERKARLFAVACHRLIFPLLQEKASSKRELEFAERFADGLATKNDLHGRAWGGQPGGAFQAVVWSAWDAAKDSAVNTSLLAGDSVLAKDKDAYAEWNRVWDDAWLKQGLFLSEARDAADSAMSPEWVERGRARVKEEQATQCRVIGDIFGNPFRPLPPLFPSLLTPRILDLAELVYRDRMMPQGIFDLESLLALADALRQAGCDEPTILDHLREPNAVHVRGCWTVDLLLGRT